VLLLVALAEEDEGVLEGAAEVAFVGEASDDDADDAAAEDDDVLNAS